ncbi:hypothetical protein SNEBB_004896 [Seison nebaliae]|nr:hypothetical protein SNEBB_004896 [Seison nebaliae]
MNCFLRTSSFYLFVVITFCVDGFLSANIHYYRQIRAKNKGRETVDVVRCEDSDGCVAVNEGVKRLTDYEYPNSILSKITESEKIRNTVANSRLTSVNGKMYLIVALRESLQSDYFGAQVQEYENPFGDPTANWIGLRLLVQLTKLNKNRKFRIEFFNLNDEKFYCEYPGVQIKPKNENYKLVLKYPVKTTIKDQFHLFPDESINRPFRTTNDLHVVSCSSQDYAFWFGKSSDCLEYNLFEHNKYITITVGDDFVLMKKIRILMELKK